MKISLQEQTKDFNFEIIRITKLKNGDVVRVNGYSFHGAKMKIERFSVRQGLFEDDLFEVFAKGSILRKDGTPGKNEGEHRVLVDIQKGCIK